MTWVMCGSCRLAREGVMQPERWHTPYYRNLHRKAADLDNRLCFYLFVTEQFRLDSAEAMRDHPPETFLGTVYPNNQYRERLHIPIERFGTAREDYQRWFLASMFIHLYAVIDVYEQELVDLAKAVIGDIVPRRESEDLLSAYLRATRIDLDTTPHREFQRTRNYLRWRRNRLIHAEGATSQDLVRLARYYGTSLEEFWHRQLRRHRHTIRFTADGLDELSIEEIIAFATIVRAMYKQIDADLATGLATRDRAAMLQEAYRAYKSHLDERQAVARRALTAPHTPEKFRRALRKFAFGRFGMQATEDELTAAQQQAMIATVRN